MIPLRQKHFGGLKSLLLLLCMVLSAQAPVVLTGGSVIRNAVIASAAATFDWNSAGLTHYWRMEEAAGNSRVDAVGAVNLTGTLVDQTTGKHNNAAWIDNCSPLTTVSLSETTQFSYSCWLKLDQFDDTGPELINKQSGTTAIDIQAHDITASGHLTEINYHSLNGGDINLDVSSLTIVTGQWFFLVFTFDGVTGQTKISVNGGTFATGSGSVYSPGAGDLFIVDNVNCYNFSIDELAVYNTVLSQSQVTQLWNSGSGVFYTP